jgi:hypothetical protein
MELLDGGGGCQCDAATTEGAEHVPRLVPEKDTIREAATEKWRGGADPALAEGSWRGARPDDVPKRD